VTAISVLCNDEYVESTEQGQSATEPPGPKPDSGTLISPAQPVIRAQKAILILVGSLFGAAMLIAVGWNFRRAFAYTGVVLPTVIALTALLFKDWKNYKHIWIRRSLVVVVVASGFYSVHSQIAQQDEKEASTRETNAIMRGLKGQIEVAQQAQGISAKVFLDKFQDLSGKLNDLELHAATKEDRDRIAALTTELQRTRMDLNPPKASFVFTLSPHPDVYEGKPFQAITEMSLPTQADGTVHVRFAAVNPTNATAEDGQFTLFLCDGCGFPKQTGTFRSLGTGFSKEQVTFFNRILPKTQMELSADITPPLTASQLPIEIAYRCRTCAVNLGTWKALVHIAR
jgi:hypothetical protein